MRVAIQGRINELLASRDNRIAWVKPAVRQHGFLPLHLGWVAVLGICPDGSFVRWDHDAQPPVVQPLDDPYWERMAICQGVREYPELAPLVPARPESAQTCPDCGGSGEVTGLPLVCQCGGAGWIIPGERRGPSPG